MKNSEKDTLVGILGESTSSALLCLDDQFNIVFVNQGFADIYEKSRDYFEQKNYFDLIPNSLLKGIFKNVLHKKEEFILQAEPFQFADAPKKMQMWDWSIKPFSNGKQSYLLIQLNDVSHQIRSKENELRQEKRYKKLFERSLSGLYQRTIDGKILNCNDAYAKILGFDSKNEVIGKNLHDIINLTKNELIKVWSNLVNDRLETTETSFKLNNSTKKWVLESGILIQGNTFKESQIEGSIIDITPMKKATQKLSANQEKIIDLQMQMLSAQMNPHFIFNAVNSISGYIAEEDMEKAMIYTVEFADLIRTVLENSVNKSITLSDELSFLNKYAGLEKLRGSSSFEVSFEIGEKLDLNKDKVPAMIVQPFLENAIIHGVSNVEEGKINISFEKISNKSVLCKVIDNGKGFPSKSSNDKKHKSLGISITGNRLNLFNNKKKKYRVEQGNLKDGEGHIIGAEVKIYIPILK